MPHHRHHLQAYVVLNVSADLRSEFTWNTKQLFVYVNVEFGTRKNARNSMVMWSRIIEHKVWLTGAGAGCWVEGERGKWQGDRAVMLRQPPAAASLPALLPTLAPSPPPPPQESAVLRLPTLRPAYPYAVTDQGFNLRGRPFNVTVGWNVMPRVGALYSRHRTFSGACVVA